MIRTILFCVGIVLFFACNNQNSFKFEKVITLDNTGPISAAFHNGYLWVSDSKNNRLLKIDETGKTVESTGSLGRPMHISSVKDVLLVPEYLSDSVKSVSHGTVKNIDLEIKPDAPSGVDGNDSLIVIADFYNHRLIIKSPGKTYTIGKKGHENGELFYPTDVKIFEDKIIVADAYNNRIQIFNFAGKHLKTLGAEAGIKVASGIDANAQNIFVTDSENNRLLIFDWDGNKTKVLSSHLDYPIDVLYHDNKLYVSNFHGSSITVFSR